MKGRWWKPAQGRRERLGSDGPDLGNRAQAKSLGQNRSASNRRGTTTAQEACFRNVAVRDSRREFQYVAADGIAYFDDGGGFGKFAGIARVTKVIENSFAEHF